MMRRVTTKNTLEGQAALVDKLLQEKLDTTLEAYLTAGRGVGDSYDEIARTLSSTIDFRVSWSWVRRWTIRLGIEEGAA